MEELNVVIYAKAGDGGRLFGSITSKDIAEQSDLAFLILLLVLLNL